jgi:hypothetical protein
MLSIAADTTASFSRVSVNTGFCGWAAIVADAARAIKQVENFLAIAMAVTSAKFSLLFPLLLLINNQ